MFFFAFFFWNWFNDRRKIYFNPYYTHTHCQYKWLACVSGYSISGSPINWSIVVVVLKEKHLYLNNNNNNFNDDCVMSKDCQIQFDLSIIDWLSEWVNQLEWRNKTTKAATRKHYPFQNPSSSSSSSIWSSNEQNKHQMK